MNRRSFLASTGVLLADQILSQTAPARAADKRRMHHALRIEPCKLEIAPGIVIDTIGYNGLVPGPLLRLREGVPISIDVVNQSARAEIVHWHGLAADSLNDGAMEEGSPMIPAGGTTDNQSWPKIDPLHLRQGRRYRIIFRNGSGDRHPMHLHRHTFEVTRVGTKEFGGLRKDVVNVMPLDSVAVDFMADNPGDTLLHCHQALHMDFGFMQLMKYAA